MGGGDECLRKFVLYIFDICIPPDCSERIYLIFVFGLDTRNNNIRYSLSVSLLGTKYWISILGKPSGYEYI